MQEKEELITPTFYYGDSVFKDVMQSVMDKAWIVAFTRPPLILGRMGEIGSASKKPEVCRFGRVYKWTKGTFVFL